MGSTEGGDTPLASPTPFSPFDAHTQELEPIPSKTFLPLSAQAHCRQRATVPCSASLSWM